MKILTLVSVPANWFIFGGSDFTQMFAKVIFGIQTRGFEILYTFLDMDMALDTIVPETLKWRHTDEGPEYVAPVSCEHLHILMRL